MVEQQAVLRQEEPTAAAAASSSSPSGQRVRQRAVTPFRAGRQTPYRCHCGFLLEAREVMNQASEHYGRLFVSCQRSRADPGRCDYFRWL